jgi:hypothetical protein
MSKYVKDIAINIHENAEWDSDAASKSLVDPPAGIISNIIKAKSVGYRTADELWLIISSSGLNSEMILPIKGIGEFCEHNRLNENVANSPFARVYAFTAMGLFRWCRGRGWQGPTVAA